MEQKQVSLNEIYQKLLFLERFVKKVNAYIEDSEFARRTEEAWEEIDAGKCKTYSLEEFHKKLKDD